LLQTDDEHPDAKFAMETEDSQCELWDAVRYDGGTPSGIATLCATKFTTNCN
jgi:hypothetical protein